MNFFGFSFLYAYKFHNRSTKIFAGSHHRIFILMNCCLKGYLMPRSRWWHCRTLRWTVLDIASGIFARSRCRVVFGGLLGQTTPDHASYKHTFLIAMNQGNNFVIAIFSKFWFFNIFMTSYFFVFVPLLLTDENWSFCVFFSTRLITSTENNKKGIFLNIIYFI